MVLNSDQKRVYSTIIKDAEKLNKTKPLILFVSGEAGTGKSVLIRELVLNIGAQHVIVCAPTAMAGKNINGSTIHSIFKLDPNSKEDQILPPHPFLKLLIIDEISMCDEKLFERVEKRMKQIMRKDDVPFGGCTVALFGDLLQIPPVNGNWIFNAPIWKKMVQFEELEINMRQENDTEYSAMLRRWRLGFYTYSDTILLNDKAKENGSNEVQRFCDLNSSPKNIMILTHTNKIVAWYNEEITHTIFDESELHMLTEYTRNVHIQSNTTTIEHTNLFKIANGSRVLINRNINSTFVNGDIGVVKNLREKDKYITEIHLKLSDGSTRQFPLSSRQVSGNSGYGKWKCEFNIQPAYAMTYHKAQGQTLDKVFIVADSTLPPALFYVGASRVRTLDDLYITHKDSHDAILADPNALEEYKRLRISSGRSPLPEV